MAQLVQLVDGVAASRFELGEGQVTIGRAPDNAIYIEDALVSGRHARIEWVAEGEGGYWELRDLDSTNGTRVNEVNVMRHRLTHHDLIGLGLHQFLFVDESVPDIETTKKLKKSWIPGVYYTKD
jgi:pSer/pThr/pTyr-binding forkhead associated (FHA) protein